MRDIIQIMSEKHSSLCISTGHQLMVGEEAGRQRPGSRQRIHFI